MAIKEAVIQLDQYRRAILKKAYALLSQEEKAELIEHIKAKRRLAREYAKAGGRALAKVQDEAIFKAMKEKG